MQINDNISANPEQALNPIKQVSILPPLKRTVKIHDGGFDFWQDKVWILSDTISNKYYYLGRFEYEIISHWQEGDIEEFVEKVNAETILNVKKEDVEFVLRFLLTNNLLQVSSAVLDKIKSQRNSSVQKVFKIASKFFYFRVPLINPDKFLEKTQKYIKPIISKGFACFILFLFVIDVYLLAINWGSFSGSLPSITDFSSIILIMCTLAFTKVIHEFGHGYCCKILGGKVSEMGVTFIFFYPLFYTDVSNSILLDSKKRLVISTAGIRFEMYLAVIAGFFWFFVADGTVLKSLLFFVAGVSWMISIAINMMPFIRFDGYYILSDFMKIRNLGVRANSILKYYSRTYLFGIDSILPESYNKKKYRFFLTFSLMTGIYRVFVFSGILLFLYYIEVVGIALFSFGIAMLLLMPFLRELYTVWNLRKNMKTTKNIIYTSSLAVGIILLLFIPITNNIYMPSVYYAKTQRVYTPFESKIDNINIELNQFVKKGQKLLSLSNPKLTTDKIINLLNLQTEEYYSSGSLLSDETRKALVAKQSEIKYQRTIGENLELKSEQLRILAPFDGKIVAIKDDLYSDIWLGDKAWLFDIVDFDKYNVQSFISATDLQNTSIDNKSKMLFIPDQIKLSTCNVQLKSIAKEPINKIPKAPITPLSVAESTIVNSNLLMFSSYYGDKINFAVDQDNNWVPVEAYFTVDLAPNTNCNYKNNQIIKGVVKIKADSRSVASRVYERVKNALLKFT